MTVPAAPSTSSTLAASTDNVRPSEAQLRWAQFHHPRRAVRVKAQVERLYQTPLEVQEVEEAESQDGRTTSESEKESGKSPRRTAKPRVSRGRRALLRVSRRKYEKRRAYILEHGYQERLLADGEEPVQSEYDDEDEEDEMLREIFTAGTATRKRRRQRRQTTKRLDSETEQRLRSQFKLARQAMMVNLMAPPKLEVAIPTKRWTRTAEHIAASDEFHFDDLNWGISRGTGSHPVSAGQERSFLPLDRGASWLIHVPDKVSAARPMPYHYFHERPPGTEMEHISETSSTVSSSLRRVPGRIPFDQLVEAVQHQVLSHGVNLVDSNPRPRPKTRLDYFAPDAEAVLHGREEKKDDSEMNFKIQSYMEAVSPSREEQDNSRVKQMCLRLQGATSDGLESPRRHLHPLGERFESPASTSPLRRKEHPMGQLFQSNLVTPSSAGRSAGGSPGKLDISLFENYCQKCGERQSDAGENDDMNSDFFQHVRNLDPERRFRGKEKTAVCQGCNEVFRSLTVEPLNSPIEKDVHQLVVPEETNQNGSSQPSSPKQSLATGRQKPTRDAVISGILNRGKSNISSAIHSFHVNPDGKQHADDGTFSSASVSSRFGKMITRARKSIQSIDLTASEDSDLNAISSFRRSQGERRKSAETDESSSLSSFRVIPGFRKIVQGLQGKKDQEDLPPDFGTGHKKPIEPTVHEDFEEDSGVMTSTPPGSVIDTDETQATGLGNSVNAANIANLLLSPTLLNKRLKQAIRAAEKRNWEQVAYLVNANPWLAEMMELTTNQFLLHKLAFYGAEPPASDELNNTLVNLFPSAVHKFDVDGNVPLHLAAASGNMSMIKLLGERFPSGASVRNEEGMLALHFAIATIKEVMNARAEKLSDNGSSAPTPTQVVKTVLSFFPNAVAIPDNEGNLPLHIAAACLDGSVGVDICFMLLDEAERQLKDPFGARFHNKVKMEEIPEIESVVTEDTENDRLSSFSMEGLLHCNMVRNECGETPLHTAIKSRNSWEIVEAIASGPAGWDSATSQDASGNNSLHLLLSEDYLNPTAALSILKVAPEAASAKNVDGVLPIEYACMAAVPEQIILALVLADLPIDIDVKNEVRASDRSGDSWWFVTCESDDHYVGVVEQVVGLCTSQQARELCLVQGGSPSKNTGTVLSRSTPMCRLVLNASLRLGGRFEVVGDSQESSIPSIDAVCFDAIDFGNALDSEDPDEGKRVLLYCFSSEQAMSRQTEQLREVTLEATLMEEILTFRANDYIVGSTSCKFCMSVQMPILTLDRVIVSMHNNEAYKRDPNLRRRYSAKIGGVLRAVAKCAKRIHDAGAIHGNISTLSCAKFEDSWKLSGRLGVQRIGTVFDVVRWGKSFPPEAVCEDDVGEKVSDSDDIAVSWRQDLVCDVSIDVWGFGKLAFEALVGHALIPCDSTTNIAKILQLDTMEWSETNLRDSFHEMLDVGIPDSGAEVIASCLMPNPRDRPTSFDEILRSPFWKEMKAHRENSRRSS